MAANYIFAEEQFVKSQKSDTGLHLISGPSSNSWCTLDYPRGAQLCFQGCAAEGVFRIVDGSAKECFTSESGRMAILRIAGPGDLIGLEAVLCSGQYANTVQALEPTKACFLTKRDLLGALRCDEKFRMQVVHQLGDRCKTAYTDIRRFALTTSVAGRFAHFLLGWKRTRPGRESCPEIQINLTHEEIGQLLCTSRETISRLVSDFRQKGWITITGVRWRIQDRRALAALGQI